MLKSYNFTGSIGDLFSGSIFFSFTLHSESNKEAWEEETAA